MTFWDILRSYFRECKPTMDKIDVVCQKWPKVSFLTFLAQKASKVIIWIFSGFEDSSRKERGSLRARGGTQSWPGTAIVNHPLRQQNRPRLSYFPYIFYFVNFTISAAIRQGLFGSFENVIKDFGKFRVFWESATFCVGDWPLKVSAFLRFSGYFGCSSGGGMKRGCLSTPTWKVEIGPGRNISKVSGFE